MSSQQTTQRQTESFRLGLELIFLEKKARYIYRKEKRKRAQTLPAKLHTKMAANPRLMPKFSFANCVINETHEQHRKSLEARGTWNEHALLLNSGCLLKTIMVCFHRFRTRSLLEKRVAKMLPLWRNAPSVSRSLSCRTSPVVSYL